mgnify:FL=1
MRDVKVSRVFFILLASLIIGFLLGLAIKYRYEASMFEPYTWKHPPAIINCYGPDFNEYQIKRAINYWEDNGYPIGFYEHDPPSSVCDNSWLEGFIILRRTRSLPANTIASTQRYSRYFEMIGAIIYYQSGSFNLDLINEHELGHALGFTHIDEPGHIMHPLYHKMGRQFWLP